MNTTELCADYITRTFKNLAKAKLTIEEFTATENQLWLNTLSLLSTLDKPSLICLILSILENECYENKIVNELLKGVLTND